MSASVLSRAVRRETHSPRTVAAVVVLLLIAAGAVYAGIEIVLWSLKAMPLVMSPGAVLQGIIDVPRSAPIGVIVGSGIVLVAIGLGLLWLATAPGHRSNHELRRDTAQGHVAIVDNGVVASAIAERLRRELDMPRGAVVVGVGHRSADVTVRPDLGQEVDTALIGSLTESELENYNLSPRVRVRTRVVRSKEKGPEDE